MVHGVALAVALLVGTGAARTEPAVVGTWTHGSVRLAVAQDGRFDWAVGPRASEGRWSADASLLSLTTSVGEVTYAWRIEGDRLILSDPRGAEVSLARCRRCD